MCLTLGAELRIAAESAVFHSTGIVNGLTSTELGVSWFLPRLIGAARSTAILFTGRVVDAVAAGQMGLVSRVVPHEALLAVALEMSSTVCGDSP